MTVDSLAKPNADAISYRIRNANPAHEEDSVRYREAANLVRTALSGRGLYEAPANTKAEVIVDLDYGVTSRVRREKVMYPEWNAVPSAPKWERDPDKAGYDSIAPVAFDPAPRLKEREIVTTTYEKYLRLTARELVPATAGRPPAEIWTVDVTSEGSNSDIRKYLPILAAASIDYVGKDSHGQKTIRLKDSDADVAFVKKGM